ncbi:two-component regulator propeller domain-containing protein [candidate division CSSED10-310 bacterium]|uniref:histidine kinase n=1 Tax=candidate division CSSED10-310 bacterium TaxID=2855610 RepID=A0ABV6YQZ9_UNCC1
MQPRFGTKCIIWLTVFFFLIINHALILAQIQDYRIYRIPIDQKPSQHSIRSIYQDRSGYLWFGTGVGLYRYDGYTFTHFNHEPADPSTISENYVLCIFEDSDGFLWIGTYGGLNKFDRTTETFKRFQHDPAQPQSISNDRVQVIYQDSRKFLWIGTAGGVNKFDPETEDFTYYGHDPGNPGSLCHNDVNAILEDQAGMLWIGTEGGLAKFNHKNEKFEAYLNEPHNPHSLPHNNVTSLVVDQAGFIWVGTRGGGLSRLNKANEIFDLYIHDPGDDDSLSNNNIFSLHHDGDGIIWIGTADGLNSFKYKEGIFIHYKSDPANSFSISKNDVRCLFEDRSGILWIGTRAGGINKLDKKRRFIHLKKDVSRTNSLSHNSVFSILEDSRGLLWLGTVGGGLNCYDPLQNSFTIYRPNPQDGNSISSDQIISISEDRSGHQLIGTFSGELNFYDRETNTFSFFEIPALDDDSQAITSLYEDREKNLWVGTFSGLMVFDRDTHSFTTFQHNPDLKNTLSSNEVTAILEDKGGQFWIGTRAGLNLYAREKKHFRCFRNQKNNPKTLSDDRILTLYEDSKGRFWIGTNIGLNLFDRKTGECKRYTVEDGLPHNWIGGILEDSNGNLWLSTQKGLSKFNPDKEECINYDARNGLPGDKFYPGACFKGREGTLYFGSPNGLIYFQPHDIKANPLEPPVYISAFKKFGQRVTFSRPLTALDEITLDYDENVFSFELVALDFTNPAQNQFAYQLEGYDRDWIDNGSHRNTSNYENLSPGRYVFRVRGSNSDGVWNEQGASIQIRIKPPLWRTWWAYCIYCYTLAMVVFIGYVRRKSKLQATKLEQQEKELEHQRLIAEKLRKVDKLKDEFLANTSHELRTPLAGIIGITESLVDGATGPLAPETSENLSLILSSGNRLLLLVNDILDFSKLKSDELILQRKAIDMRQIAEIVLKQSKPLLSGKPITLRNEIKPDIPAVDGDENRLQQIMHNLVSNAIKFTDSGVIIISGMAENQQVHISVTDTGIGIPADKLHDIFASFEQVDGSIQREYGGTGLGLSITKKLIELHGGTIIVASTLGQGSKFTFTVPTSSKEIVQSESSETKQSLFREDHPVDMAQQIPAVPEGALKILVVDDELINVKVLTNLLSLSQYDVIQTMSGSEALALLEEGLKPDLVLLDLMMPKMSGYEVCKKIREKYAMTELSIIMLTAKNQIADLVDGFEAGANDYLTKPFSKGELLARIKTHINLSNINRSYSRFVPQEFLQYLHKESIVDVRLGDQVQQEMTVMFSDIRSFTTLSEHMNPQENFNFLNSYLRRIGPVIRKHNGFIDKYIGDAIMALFPGSAEDAVLAAIEMMAKLAEFNGDRLKENLEPVSIGVGLHTGKLILGTIGEELRMETTVIADAVNLASRIEGLTKLYGALIVVSEQTLSQIQDPSRYNYRFLGFVQVKGKKEPVSVYEVYDGDSEEIITLKKQTRKDFESGLRAYYNKEFADAVVCFKKVLQTFPHDKTAELFLRRAAELVVKTVPDDWSGVETLDMK